MTVRMICHEVLVMILAMTLTLMRRDIDPISPPTQVVVVVKIVESQRSNQKGSRPA